MFRSLLPPSATDPPPLHMQTLPQTPADALTRRGANASPAPEKFPDRLSDKPSGYPALLPLTTSTGSSSVAVVAARGMLTTPTGRAMGASSSHASGGGPVSFASLALHERPLTGSGSGVGSARAVAAAAAAAAINVERPSSGNPSSRPLWPSSGLTQPVSGAVGATTAHRPDKTSTSTYAPLAPPSLVRARVTVFVISLQLILRFIMPCI